ncbi:MAG TPA: DUF3099 domain-containing protein [Pseudonocardiaceae bacterium]
MKGSQRGGTPGTPDSPVLITEAAPSYQEQWAARRRKYAIMMGMRIPLLLTAVFLYQTPWLAMTLILLSVPLPWMAVLIANDRPARKVERVNRLRPDSRARQLEAREHPIIDGTYRDGS